MQTSASCEVTVGYAFVVKEDIPSWDAWANYFEGCPRGSFTVAVHSQAGPHARSQLASLIGHLQGELVSPERTVFAHLRYSFQMIRAMFRVLSLTAGQTAPFSGCSPRWVHLSSDSCAPIAA